MTVRRVAVIGAGPIGLAAALAAVKRGMEPTVLEQGRVGEALRRWGGTSFFTPLSMNLPDGARSLLRAAPPPDALLTGVQMADDVLEPLAASPPLAGRVLTGRRVAGVARAGLTRHELAGHPLRAERPFRLLVEGPEGEATLEADLVLDASGTYDRACWCGPGGLPARGERAAGGSIVRRLGELHARREAMRGSCILVVGHGHSAANALLELDRLAREAPGTRLTLATRSSHARPFAEAAADPLPERARVASAANSLAASPPPFLTVRRRAVVEEVSKGRDGFVVSFAGGASERFDHVASFTGYAPSMEMLSELALEIDPATQGSARLARALAGATDCLAVPRVAPADLSSGEPGFHLIGAKSYGRARSFLLRTGIEHLAAILEMA